MYAALINNGVRVSHEIWQVKIPIKIKIFLWYLKKGVILTNDNFARRNWTGDTSCSFCHSPETIQHFFSCSYAKFLWRAVYLLFGISPPQSTEELFNSWSKMGGNKQNLLLLTAASALLSAVWLTRNEVVFDRCRPKSFLQILFREPTGSGNGRNCSGMTTNGTSSCLLRATKRRRRYNSLVPMGGCQIGLLVWFSQETYLFSLVCMDVSSNFYSAV
jgi:hypothetical protein